MEGGVKHADLRDGFSHDFLAGVDAHDVRGVVQGSKLRALLQGLHDGVGNPDRAREGLGAVDNAVTHRVNLGQRGNAAVFGAGDALNDSLDGVGMVLHGHVGALELALGGLVIELPVDADALAKALGQHFVGIGFNQLILQGRAAGVDDKNFHIIPPQKVFCLI